MRVKILIFFFLTSCAELLFLPSTLHPCARREGNCFDISINSQSASKIENEFTLKPFKQNTEKVGLAKESYSESIISHFSLSGIKDRLQLSLLLPQIVKKGAELFKKKIKNGTKGYYLE